MRSIEAERMMSIEMERWRVFFEKSGEDLWTVIDWALTIAAVNYPDELRMRRDGYAEKLFAPSNYALVSRATTLTGSDVRVATKQDNDQGEGRTRSYDDGEARIAAEGDEDEQIRQIISIGQRLDSLEESCAEEEFLKPLQTLEQMQISVEGLKVTGIGKSVNNLRKHPSKRVKAGAKKLVRLWKDVVDEWAKTAGDAAADEIAGTNHEDEEGELIENRIERADPITHAPQSRVELLSSSVNSSVTQPNAEGVDDDMFRCSPPDDGFQRNVALANLPSERSNSKLNGYRKDSTTTNFLRPNGRYANDYKSETGGSSANRTGVTGPSGTATTDHLNASKKPPAATRLAKPQTSPLELEAVKRKLHENYQQAANAKKQRTVQVMDLEDVPGQDRPSNVRTTVGNGSRRAGQMKL